MFGPNSLPMTSGTLAGSSVPTYASVLAGHTDRRRQLSMSSDGGGSDRSLSELMAKQQVAISPSTFPTHHLLPIHRSVAISPQFFPSTPYSLLPSPNGYSYGILMTFSEMDRKHLRDQRSRLLVHPNFICTLLLSCYNFNCGLLKLVG